jgi:cytochrome c553
MKREARMQHRLFTCIAGTVVAFLATTNVRAADPDPIEAKVQACAACHGADGSSKLPDTPSLAGQPKQFITTQLVMFREGNRKNAVMNAMAAPLSNADINAIGTWFSSKTLAAPTTTAPANIVAEGEKLTQTMNCVQCHGPALKGQQHIPRIAGQQTVYLRAQLTGFHAGTRFDMDGNMTAAAQSLTAEQIEVLATYLGALR